MPAVARIGDTFTCGDTIKSGSANVFANGLPVGRITDGTTGHGCSSGSAPATVIADGSGTVFANGIPLSRVSDGLVPHACGSTPHGGTINSGSPNVTADGA